MSAAYIPILIASEVNRAPGRILGVSWRTWALSMLAAAAFCILGAPWGVLYPGRALGAEAGRRIKISTCEAAFLEVHFNLRLSGKPIM